MTNALKIFLAENLFAVALAILAIFCFGARVDYVAVIFSTWVVVEIVTHLEAGGWRT